MSAYLIITTSNFMTRQWHRRPLSCALEEQAKKKNDTRHASQATWTRHYFICRPCRAVISPHYDVLEISCRAFKAFADDGERGFARDAMRESHACRTATPHRSPEPQLSLSPQGRIRRCLPRHYRSPPRFHFPSRAPIWPAHLTG